MLVIVRTARSEKEVRLPAGSRASEALASLGMSLTHHLVIRGGKPIPSDEGLSNGDVIDVVEVFSGG
jgi:sulfur carrier protein ThiS